MNADDPRDPSIDAAYRASARDEPPPALDARILAAAHRAVEARPAPIRRSFAQRWRIPVALAATVVLSATVTLMVYESERAPPIPEELSPGQFREDRAAPEAAAGRDAPDKESEAREGKLPALQERPRRESAPAVPRLGTPADEDVPRQLRSQKPDRTMSNEAKSAPAPFPAEPARPAAPPAAEAPRAKDGVEGLTKKREVPGAASAPAAEAETAPSITRERAFIDRPAGRAERDASAGAAQSALRSPEDWIAEIRRMRQAGRTDDANRLLAEFRERFPDQPLPEDLR